MDPSPDLIKNRLNILYSRKKVCQSALSGRID